MFSVKVQLIIVALAGPPRPSPTHTPAPGLASPVVFLVKMQLVNVASACLDTATPPPPELGPTAEFPSNTQFVTVAWRPLSHTPPPRRGVLFWMKRQSVSVAVPRSVSPVTSIAPPPLSVGSLTLLRSNVQVVKM